MKFIKMMIQRLKIGKEKENAVKHNRKMTVTGVKEGIYMYSGFVMTVEQKRT